MPKKYFVVTLGREHAVTLSSASEGASHELTVKTDAGRVQSTRGTAAQHVALINGRVFRLEKTGDDLKLVLRRQRFAVQVCDRPKLAAVTARLAAASKHRIVEAPLPGQVVAVAVSAGEHVVPGQRLLVIEAMKMQNPIVAEQEGTVVRIHVSVGATVQTGTKLIELHT